MRRKLSLFPLVPEFFWTFVALSSTPVSSMASSPIPPPPAVSIPVWSLACPATSLSIIDNKTAKAGAATATTPGREASTSTSTSTSNQTIATSMNIVTYCMPVSIVQPKIWTIALYHNTVTKDSFLRSGRGVLQLLKHNHSVVVPILGKRSGYDNTYSKYSECHKVGYDWILVPQKANCREEEEVAADNLDFFDCEHHVLPNCASYVQLELLEEKPVIDVGDHVVVMAKVVQTGVWDEETQAVRRASSSSMSTVGGGGAVSATENSSSPSITRRSVLPPPPLDETTVLYTGHLRREGII